MGVGRGGVGGEKSGGVNKTWDLGSWEGAIKALGYPQGSSQGVPGPGSGTEGD